MLPIKQSPVYGHLAAGVTILIWGTTLVSTKTLLVAFQPVEILFFRFLLGYFALLALCPRFLRGVPLRHEVYLMAAGRWFTRSPPTCPSSFQRRLFLQRFFRSFSLNRNPVLARGSSSGSFLRWLASRWLCATALRLL